jgi:hypothetical protein
VHAPSEEKSDNLKDSFTGFRTCIFNNYPKYHMKILLGGFNAKMGRHDILKLIIWNTSLDQDNNDNAVRIVNFTTYKFCF